jgi:hypothetical protein
MYPYPLWVIRILGNAIRVNQCLKYFSGRNE